MFRQLGSTLGGYGRSGDRAITLKFDGRAVAALFPKAASFDGFVMVERGRDSGGRPMTLDLLLRPADAAAGGSGSTTAGGCTRVAPSDAALRLEKAWLARDRGVAVLLRGQLRCPDLAGGTVMMERVPCLPQPPVLPDTGVSTGRGGRSNQRQQQQQRRRRSPPSVNSSNPADAASARADVVFRAVMSAEKVIRSADHVAARADASAARAREVTTRLQQLQDASGLGLEAAMGPGGAKAKAKTTKAVGIAGEGVIGMTNKATKQDSELRPGTGGAAWGASPARPWEENPGVKAWRAVKEGRDTAAVAQAAGHGARRSAEKAEVAAEGLRAVWAQFRRQLKEQVGLGEATRAALEAQEREARAVEDMAFDGAVNALAVSDKAIDAANDLLCVVERAEEAAKRYDRMYGRGA